MEIHLGRFGVVITILAVMILVDYITGLMKAVYTKEVVLISAIKLIRKAAIFIVIKGTDYCAKEVKRRK